MYVCVCVYCLLAYVKKRPRPNFSKFSVHVTCGRGSVILWRQCNRLLKNSDGFHTMHVSAHVNTVHRIVSLCTSGFVDNVMFVHNGLYGAWLRVRSHNARIRASAAFATGCERPLRGPVVKVSHQGTAQGEVMTSTIAFFRGLVLQGTAD